MAESVNNQSLSAVTEGHDGNTTNKTSSKAKVTATTAKLTIAATATTKTRRGKQLQHQQKQKQESQLQQPAKSKYNQSYKFIRATTNSTTTTNNNNSNIHNNFTSGSLTKPLEQNLEPKVVTTTATSITKETTRRSTSNSRQSLTKNLRRSSSRNANNASPVSSTANLARSDRKRHHPTASEESEKPKGEQNTFFFCFLFFGRFFWLHEIISLSIFTKTVPLLHFFFVQCIKIFVCTYIIRRQTKKKSPKI